MYQNSKTYGTVLTCWKLICQRRYRPQNDIKQDVALMGRNTTGPPWVSDARPPARPSARPPSGSVTDDDRHQRAKQYWPIRQASNKILPKNSYNWRNTEAAKSADQWCQATKTRVNNFRLTEQFHNVNTMAITFFLDYDLVHNITT